MPGSTQLALLACMVVPSISLRIQDSTKKHVFCKVCPADTTDLWNTWVVTERDPHQDPSWLGSVFASNNSGCVKFQVEGKYATCTFDDMKYLHFPRDPEFPRPRALAGFHDRVRTEVKNLQAEGSKHVFEWVRYWNFAQDAVKEVEREEIIKLAADRERKREEKNKLAADLWVFIRQHKFLTARPHQGKTCEEGYSFHPEANGESVKGVGGDKDGGASWAGKCVVVLEETDRPGLAWRTGDKCSSSSETRAETGDEEPFKGIDSSEMASRAAMRLCMAIFCDTKTDKEACTIEYLNLYCQKGTTCDELVCKKHITCAGDVYRLY